MPLLLLSQLYPDMGVSAMLKNQWTDASFSIGALSDRTPFHNEDEIIVLAAPDPQGDNASRPTNPRLPEGAPLLHTCADRTISAIASPWLSMNDCWSDFKGCTPQSTEISSGHAGLEAAKKITAAATEAGKTVVMFNPRLARCTVWRIFAYSSLSLYRKDSPPPSSVMSQDTGHRLTISAAC